jgi:hypothetical protein
MPSASILLVLLSSRVVFLADVIEVGSREDLKSRDM